MKPLLMVAAVIGAGMAVLIWFDQAHNPADDNWTDPQQPPPMVAPSMATASGGRISQSFPYTRTYPASLSAWSESAIGDC